MVRIKPFGFEGVFDLLNALAVRERTESDNQSHETKRPLIPKNRFISDHYLVLHVLRCQCIVLQRQFLVSLRILVCTKIHEFGFCGSELHEFPWGTSSMA